MAEPVEHHPRGLTVLFFTEMWERFSFYLMLGIGGFKPNISTLVGNLYPPDSKLRDAGYSIFYMGINLGAFLCNFVAAFVRNTFDQHPLHVTSTWEIGGWHAAFATAAIGMLL